MSEGLLAAIIGVCGTIIGTIVGWLLGKINLGDLKIEIVNSVMTQTYQSSATKEVLVEITDNFTISLYNSSNENKVFSYAKLLFVGEDGNILTINIKDNCATTVSYVHFHTDDIGVINVPPKSGVKISAYTSVSKDLEKILGAKKIILSYKTDKHKEKRLPISSINYKGIEMSKDRVKPITFLSEE
jgi:hypothetical protein